MTLIWRSRTEAFLRPLAVAIRELSVTYAMPIVATTPWLLAAQDMAKVFEADAHPKHACEGETSLMMLIAKDVLDA